eukprot:TRINITY_DN20020_c0_g1_i1.p1 TRINITY_DN20020_c0_g1~~TRINITY_DN20020_c0_g1_i1.p1  ORF type:complete len:366 (+),score=56.98 TRINITY_DN20020_c0_g1_i1:53-1099(+)
MAVTEVTFDEVLPQSPFARCCSAFCGIVFMILIILFLPCTVVQLDQFKIGLARNKVTGVVNLDKTYTPGRHWIGFWRQFIEFPSVLNTIEFSDETPEANVQQLSTLKSRDKDGKQVFLEVSIQYRLKPEKLGQIYKEMTLQYEDILISELRDSLSKAGNKFAIAAVWQDYERIAELLKATCVEALARRHAICWGLQLWGVTLTETYQATIIKTEVTKQAQKTMNFVKEKAIVESGTRTKLAEYTAQIKEIQGQVNANILRLQRSAEANAQGALISADAKILDIIRETLVFNRSQLENMTDLTRPLEEYEKMRLTNSQLVKYKKAALLATQKSVPFVYRPFSTVGNIVD